MLCWRNAVRAGRLQESRIRHGGTETQRKAGLLRYDLVFPPVFLLWWVCMLIRLLNDAGAGRRKLRRPAPAGVLLIQDLEAEA